MSVRKRGARGEGAAARATAARLALALTVPLLVPLALPALAPLPAAAQEATRPAEVFVRASAESGFGRLRFDFDADVTIAAQASNGVLVIRFDRPVRIREERIAEQLPGYVSVVRRDPDGTGLRFALTQNFRPNVLQAGETSFVDLLPERWVGLPPGLPTDVVAALARRAREAEARFEAERAARSEATAPLRVSVAELPGLARLIFEPPAGAAIETREEEDGALSLRFAGRLRLQSERPLGAVPGIARVETDAAGDALFVRLTFAEGHSARRFREDGTLVVDIETPAPEGSEETEADAPRPDPIRAALELFPFPPLMGGAGLASATAAPEEAGAPLDAVATAPEPTPDRPAPEPQRAAAPAPDRTPTTPPLEAAPLVLAEEGLSLTLPFARQPPAAAFLRGDTLFAIFQSDEAPELPRFDEDARDIARPVGTTREGPFVTYRFALPQTRVVRLAPAETGWTLTIGEVSPGAPEPLEAHPIVDENGRTALRVPLEGASGVHWINPIAGGERLAIVTATAPARNMATSRRFAELALPPTAHGLVVSAIADDVVVRVDLDGVVIGRGGGLAVGVPGRNAAGGEIAPERLVLAREVWEGAQRGSPLAAYREAILAITEAPRDARSRARLDLAVSLLANGLAVEAAGVLGFAVQEDPALGEEARVAFVQGVVATLRHRFAEAEAHFGAGPLAEDPEAALWRAFVDLQRKRHAAALAGFRRAEAVLDAYADTLQGKLRLAAVRAGIAMNDLPYAQTQLAALRLLHPGSYAADEAALLHALADARAGRTDEALQALSHLSREASRPVAAEAELARVRLSLEHGAMDAGDAVRALEQLTVSWRGDDIEVEGLGMLGRLYAADGRWREAFFAAHTANLIFPDHPVTLGLHEETARVFDDLFLADRAADLGEVEAVALFFDFKEFLPIGRRGDEIVRRLSDRLVSLGLLDKASELLRHQVENRLDGAGRAAVAARLATIYLMDGKPIAALEVLTATRLAELPNAVRRARGLIEARALSDLSRTDLALEVIAEENGPEVERLRADILWTGRRWREAGEAHEALAGTSWREDRDLAPRERRDVLRAALSYALDEDALALDRLRAKFAEKMSRSEDAFAFSVLSDAGAVASAEFRQVAREVAVVDTLADFLAVMRDLNPEVGVGPGPEPAPSPSGEPDPLLPELDLPPIGEVSSL